MKTQGLKQASDKYGFDAAFGGARRDEEKSRAKERVYSFRDAKQPFGTRKISVLNCGICIMARSIKAKVFVCSHCLTGLNWIFGNTFTSKVFH